MKLLKIHNLDNVAVAVEDIEAGSIISIKGEEIKVKEEIPQGFKIALKGLNKDDDVIKYGHLIGRMTEGAERGYLIHTHNMKTNLSDKIEYKYEPNFSTEEKDFNKVPVFKGYKRKTGKVGTRNEIWIINTVGCVNTSAERIAKIAGEKITNKNIDGIHSFSHPYGCSQLGNDLLTTQKVLAGLIKHPNAGGVLIIGLGCENNQIDKLLKVAGDFDNERVRFFNSQDVLDEVEEGVEKVLELAEVMKNDERTECPISDLVLGMKCGGSDGFSGISSNPLVGRISDLITDYNGTALLTEVPEMFGAEQQLMNRAVDEKVFNDFKNMINNFKDYFLKNNQPIYENPSPGNIEGGISTLEDKSLGAIQKGGRAVITQVLNYCEEVSKKGLAVIEAPGNDGVSVTAEIVSGATLVLFTTGRGTPLGFPVPTLKISSNSNIFNKKPNWIDFNAGQLLDGSKTLDELTSEFLNYILDTASGKIKAKNEINGYREIVIWKRGVTV